MSNLRSSKPYLLLVVAAAYLLAASTGLFVLGLTEGGIISRLLIADVAATVVIWLIGTSLKNSSLYDPYWSVAPPLLILGYAFFGGGVIGIPRGGLVAVLVLAWAWRLTWNCLRRWENLTHEDFRYIDKRAQTGRFYPLVDLFGIQLLPTVLVFAGCLPFYAIFVEGGSAWNLLDVLALAVTAGAIIIEWRADRTLWQFQEKAEPGALCQEGLWARVRYPNYLGELGFWCGLWLFALAAGFQFWWTGIGFLAMVCLFRFISIPMMEARKEERRPGYRQKVSHLPMLLPKPGRMPVK